MAIEIPQSLPKKGLGLVLLLGGLGVGFWIFFRNNQSVSNGTLPGGGTSNPTVGTSAPSLTGGLSSTVPTPGVSPLTTSAGVGPLNTSLATNLQNTLNNNGTTTPVNQTPVMTGSNPGTPVYAGPPGAGGQQIGTTIGGETFNNQGQVISP